MKIDFINEPELEFGNKSFHIDIKFGIMAYGTFDSSNFLKPKEIKLGLIGTNECIEKCSEWLDSCSKGIEAKKSNHPNLFPGFPGFGEHSCFKSRFIITSELNSVISNSEIRGLSHKDIVESATQLYLQKAKDISEEHSVDVIICAIPIELLELIELPTDRKTKQRDLNRIKKDFHDLLKAKTMVFTGIPIQVILPSTYDVTKSRKQKKITLNPRGLQDEATIAWNIHTAIYYKAKGVPWRIIRDSSEFTSCFIGISYYYSSDKSRMLTSIAQVFNERGEGLILRGAMVKISKVDKQPHSNEDDAYSLLNSALSKYRNVHGNYPARVVLHKTSTYSQEELRGFANALGDHDIYTFDFLTVTDSFTRLFRIGAYPPLRGTFLSLDQTEHLLYTHGSVDFFKTYPGPYVPRSLKLKLQQVNQTPVFLAKEILALTKMNWNNTQFNGFYPITIRAARKVGKILRYIDTNQAIQHRYSYYM